MISVKIYEDYSFWRVINSPSLHCAEDYGMTLLQRDVDGASYCVHNSHKSTVIFIQIGSWTLQLNKRT